MRLLDWFRPKPAPPIIKPHELLDIYAQLGALSVDLETTKSRLEGLKLEWINTRDELRKLAQRLEKRDERAEKRAAAAAELEEPQGFDPMEAQRALRRRRNGLLHGSGEG